MATQATLAPLRLILPCIRSERNGGKGRAWTPFGKQLSQHQQRFVGFIPGGKANYVRWAGGGGFFAGNFPDLRAGRGDHCGDDIIGALSEVFDQQPGVLKDELLAHFVKLSTMPLLFGEAQRRNNDESARSSRDLPLRNCSAISVASSRSIASIR